MLKMLDLFSGIGGFSLAASWTGCIETIAFCEIEPYCQKVLQKHWPDIPIYPDIKELSGHELVERCGAIDIVVGGFPCQPFSVAGKQRGKDDDRDLWPEMFRVIQETKPTWIIGENVANFINMELERTVINLESENYEIQPFNIPACAVNAPHQRQRTWIVAHSNNAQTTRQREYGGKILPFLESKRLNLGCGDVSNSYNQCCDVWREGPFSSITPTKKTGTNNRRRTEKYVGREWWATEPDVGRVANGIPHRVDRLKCLGNSIVPQVVYPILQAIVDIERGE